MGRFRPFKCSCGHTWVDEDGPEGRSCHACGGTAEPMIHEDEDGGVLRLRRSHRGNTTRFLYDVHHPEHGRIGLLSLAVLGRTARKPGMPRGEGVRVAQVGVKIDPAYRGHPGLLNQVRRELARKHPDVTHVGGFRLTGSRGNAHPRDAYTWVPLNEDEKQPRVIPGSGDEPDHMAPGTRPIPPGHIRFFHYTRSVSERDPLTPDQKIDRIAKEGIRYNAARGNTYGEPNAVWAAAGNSEKYPSDGHAFVEFSLHHDDPRWRGAVGASWKHDKPNGWQEEHSREMERSGTHIALPHDITPDDIVAVHKSWHHHARYAAENPEVLNGIRDTDEFDWMKNDRQYAPVYQWARRPKTESLWEALLWENTPVNRTDELISQTLDEAQTRRRRQPDERKKESAKRKAGEIARASTELVNVAFQELVGED